MKRTLSRIIFLRIAPIVIIAITFIAGFAFHSANKEINMVYDAQLTNNAEVLWTLVSDELKEAKRGDPKKVYDIEMAPLPNQRAMNEFTEKYADSRMFRVWESDETMVFSDNALPKSIPKQAPGFSTTSYENEQWRIYTLAIPNTKTVIEVGEKVSLRQKLVQNIIFDIALPLLFLLPVIGVLIWLGIHSSLGLIHNLVEQIRMRSPNDLAYVDTASLPRDLMPLGKSLNQLFTKLENSLNAEKRFADHAAHQLRTPLATLKLQLQMLQETKNDAEKQSLITELLSSSDRAAKLITTLLTTARLSHQHINLAPVNLYDSLASTMAELGTLATQKNINISLDGDTNVKVTADRDLLKLMFSNIIENAIKYTPAGGTVKVEIKIVEKKWRVLISDTGPGIPEHMRKTVFERFYRVDTPEIEGSGLGLAIVSEIIERLSGQIVLKTPDNKIGLLVEITLT